MSRPLPLDHPGGWAISANPARTERGSELTGLRLRDLAGVTLRANPRYALVPFEQLASAERELVNGLETGGRYAGLLRDAGALLSLQAVSHATAALFTELTGPTRVASIPWDGSSAVRDEVLAGLVLDGILELQADAGRFVTSSGAYLALVESDADLVGTDRIARLSVRALQQCQQLGVGEPVRLAVWLYCANRLPVTPRWQRLWPHAGAVLRHLGVHHGALGRELDAHLHRVEADAPGASWIIWQARRRPAARSPEDGRYKVYVSVLPAGVAGAFAAVVGLLSSHAVAALKIGADAHGLLRPDKLMVYFDRRDDLHGFVAALLPRIEGLPAHGVPFSAAVDRRGALSWGMDPPRNVGHVPWFQDDSFRIWICNRLAVALVAAEKLTSCAVPPWRYALARLWLSGVDTRTWELRPGAESTWEAGSGEVARPPES